VPPRQCGINHAAANEEVDEGVAAPALEPRPPTVGRIWPARTVALGRWEALAAEVRAINPRPASKEVEGRSAPVRIDTWLAGERQAVRHSPGTKVWAQWLVGSALRHMERTYQVVTDLRAATASRASTRAPNRARKIRRLARSASHHWRRSARRVPALALAGQRAPALALAA